MTFRLLLLGFALVGCGEADPPAAQRVVGGDATRGKRIAIAAGCTACHVVPGASSPMGRVGPSLAGFGRRGYIAGVLPNTPDNLVRWLRDPPSLVPATAMPEIGLGVEEARHIAAFLVTLR